MRLNSGARLGPYEILDPLGAGGMGEVYRARDSRLGRDVAIKVLPAHFAQTPELRQRFEREARAISSLNHPHICTLHDIGHQDNVDYLVMELLDGETLAARIERDALPVDQSLKIAIEVADALDKAHRNGVVHRDLKPANIMLTKSGAKLLDFGLARLVQPEAGGLLADDGRSLAASVTQSGEILGTAGYLAPEQVRGEKADARADIFALGAILFEMLTGQRAFKGDSAVATLYAIMNEDPPPVSSLVRVPPALERVVRTCLAKDPDERWQSARDLARELRWIAGESAGPLAQPGARAQATPSRARLAWTAAIAAFVAALIAGGGGLLLRGDGGSHRTRVVSSIEAPENTTFSLRNGPMAFSSDGSKLAFVATDSTGRALLWVRALDEPEARPLAGTDGAACPFWSPDGHSLGFFADAQLKRIDLAGGPPHVLVDALRGSGGSGGTWTSQGDILFSTRRGTRIFRVPANGGSAELVFDDKQGAPVQTQAWPVLLPDGRHFLFAGSGESNFGGVENVYVGSLDHDQKPVLLVSGAVNAGWAEPGRLVFWRDGRLWTQTFDPRRLRMTGEARRVVDRVAIDSDLRYGLFAVSSTGMLAYQQGGSTQLSELVWVNRAGTRIESLTPPGAYYSPRISHDGRRVAVDRSDPVTGTGDIWVFDVARRLGDRITSNPLNETCPVWSPDDRQLYWMSAVGSKAGAIHTMPSNGSGREELLFPYDDLTAPNDFTPDGNQLLFMSVNLATGKLADLNVLSLSSHKISSLRSTPFIERAARLSHDGHWVAYESNESGDLEVYVQRFPDTGEKWRVSTAGGTSAVWRDDGHEIFYVSKNHQMMSAQFRAEPSVEISVPTPLFKTEFRPNSLVAEYGVSADGQRLLINRMLSQEVAHSMTLDQNWSPGR